MFVLDPSTQNITDMCVTGRLCLTNSTHQLIVLHENPLIRDDCCGFFSREKATLSPLRGFWCRRHVISAKPGSSFSETLTVANKYVSVVSLYDV